MATATTKTRCSICEEEESSTFLCRGCATDFCFDHLTDHCQTLNRQLQQIQDDYNQFRQAFIDQKNNPDKRPLIKEINRWENNAIDKIRETAEQCRERLTNYTNKIINKIEIRLDNLREQSIPVGGKNQFNEIDLDQFRGKLKKLKEELDKAEHASIKYQPTSFLDKPLVSIPLDEDTQWKQHGITIAGGNGPGSRLNQLSFPYGILIDDDHQTMYVADYQNHRIVEWKCNATEGRIVAGGHGQGNQINQLNEPTDMLIDRETNSLIIADSENSRVMRWSCQNKNNGEVIISDIDCWGVTMDKDGSLYVSDYRKHEVRRWKRGEKGRGKIVAGGHGQGAHFNQLNCPTFIFVDDDKSLYVSDRYNHRVMKWLKDGKQGVIVAGGNGHGDSLRQLSLPQGLIVDQLGHIYVAEWGNNRVKRWCQGAEEGTIVIRGNGQGQKSKQFSCPRGLSLDRQGHLYVADWGNHRIQKFEVQ